MNEQSASNSAEDKLATMVQCFASPMVRAALLTFLLPVVTFFCSSGLFLLWGQRLEGTVVAIKYHPGSSFKNHYSPPFWSRIVRFQTQEGSLLEEEVLNSNLGVGDRVGVYYLPGTYRFKVDTFIEIWFPVIFSVAIQIVLLIVIGMLSLLSHPNPKLSRLAPFGFTFLFLCIGLAAAYPGYQQAHILKQGVQTTGIIDLESAIVAPKNKKYPIVRFRALNGREYRIPSSSFNQGAKVTVIYRPEHPQEALAFTNEEVAKIERWWVMPLIFVGPIVGISLVVIAIVSFLERECG